VIPNGVEVPPEAPSIAPATDGRLRVATVSRFNAQKNPEGLLAVLGALARRQGVAERLAVSVYGDGEVEARAAFAAQVDARGLRAMVSLRGAVPDLRAELRRHDVFLSCSRWEGLPLSVLEAMALGLPAVLSEVDGHRDILASGPHGAFGYPLTEPSRAAQVLEDLLEPEFRARSGAWARQCVAARYSRETMLQQTLAAYENLLSTSVRETTA
jgi:glycosyltransferase involved in cell wall biosynthesis